FGNAADPGIADQLGIERQHACGLFRITTRRGFPVDQTFRAIERPEGINVGNEIVVTGKSSEHLYLQVLLGTENANTIILREFLKQMNPLVNQAIPGISFSVFEESIPRSTPFLE